MTLSLERAGEKLCWLCCFLAFGFQLAGAQEADEDPFAIQFPVETKSYTLEFNDEDGNPIEGMDVIAGGVRCEEDRGSWFSWPYPNVGKNNLLRTDEKGRVTVQYPVRYGSPGHWLTTTTIDFHYVHSDFVAGNVEVAVLGEKQSDCVVEAGCPVLFTAMDGDGVSLQEFGAIVAGAGRSAQWKLEDGQLRSRGIPDGSWQTMLVRPSPDGNHLFSGILPARYRKGNGVTIRDVKLSPGIRLQGQVSLNVERPVMEGKVIAHCLPKPRGEVYARRDASLAWSDYTEIQPDGTFVFNSLPRSGTVQLIALCRGWIIQSEPRNGVGDFFVQGVQLDLDALEIKDSVVEGIELPMEAAGALEVRVVQEDGTPVEGVQVSTWPNQMMDKGGSTLLGTGHRTADALLERLEKKKEPFASWFERADVKQYARYVQRTDSEGIVLLQDIPLGREQDLHVANARFRARDTDGRANVQYLLEEPERETKEIVVVPMESTESQESEPAK